MLENNFYFFKEDTFFFILLAFYILFQLSLRNIYLINFKITRISYIIALINSFSRFTFYFFIILYNNATLKY